MSVRVSSCAWFILSAIAAAGVWLPGCGKSDSEAARIEALRRGGNVEALERELADPANVEGGRLAVAAMGSLGPQARPAIERAMRDNRAVVRESAALAYGRVTPPQQAAPLAKVARTDPSPVVRAAAVTALGQNKVYEEMESLLAALEDADPLVRRRASDAVARIVGRRYEVYLDGTPEQRREAVAKLREIWPGMKPGTTGYIDAQRRQAKP